jgi:hypothetical protein
MQFSCCVRTFVLTTSTVYTALITLQVQLHVNLSEQLCTSACRHLGKVVINKTYFNLLAPEFYI